MSESIDSNTGQQDIVAPPHNDETVIITQADHPKEETGLACDWTLHALEEFAPRDTQVSLELLQMMTKLLESQGNQDWEISISDGSSEEEVPHYILTASSGNTTTLPEQSGLFINYKQAIKPENIDIEPAELTLETLEKMHIEVEAGTMTFLVRLPNKTPEQLTGWAMQAFIYYDLEMSKYYPEYIARYDDAGFQLIEASQS